MGGNNFRKSSLIVPIQSVNAIKLMDHH